MQIQLRTAQLCKIFPIVSWWETIFKKSTFVLLNICWLRVCYTRSFSTVKYSWCPLNCLPAAFPSARARAEQLLRETPLSAFVLLAGGAVERNIWQYPTLKILSVVSPNQTKLGKANLHFLVGNPVGTKCTV